MNTDFVDDVLSSEENYIQEKEVLDTSAIKFIHENKEERKERKKAYMMEIFNMKLEEAVKTTRSIMILYFSLGLELAAAFVFCMYMLFKDTAFPTMLSKITFFGGEFILASFVIVLINRTIMYNFINRKAELISTKVKDIRAKYHNLSTTR